MPDAMPFAPGQSGNPKGRPRKSAQLAVRELIARRSKKKSEIIDFYFDLMRGNIEGSKAADREKAAAFLARWKYGSAPDVVPDEEQARESEKPPDELAKLLQFPVEPQEEANAHSSEVPSDDDEG